MERMWRKMNQGLISKPSASGKIRSNYSIAVAGSSFDTSGRASGSHSTAAVVPSPYSDNLASMPNSYPYHVPASTSDALTRHVRNNNSSATSTDSRRKRRRKSKPRCNKNNR